MWEEIAAIGGGLLSDWMSSEAQSNAASSAAGAQTAAAQGGIDEQRRQFDAVQKLLQPYVGAGMSALGEQGALLGLAGSEAQQKAISEIENSSQMKELTQQGENAILQNASATGGLRGGNTQGALAQFRPQVLNSLIDSQYAKLGGMTALGQNSAVQQGNAGMQTGTNVSNLLGTIGSAQAGNSLAQGAANSQIWSGLSNTLGTLAGSMF